MNQLTSNRSSEADLRLQQLTFAQFDENTLRNLLVDFLAVLFVLNFLHFYLTNRNSFTQPQGDNLNALSTVITPLLQVEATNNASTRAFGFINSVIIKIFAILRQRPTRTCSRSRTRSRRDNRTRSHERFYSPDRTSRTSETRTCSGSSLIENFVPQMLVIAADDGSE